MIPNSIITDKVFAYVVRVCGDDDDHTSFQEEFEITHEGQEFNISVEGSYQSKTVDRSTYDTPDVTTMVQIQLETVQISNLTAQTDISMSRTEIMALNKDLEGWN